MQLEEVLHFGSSRGVVYLSCLGVRSSTETQARGFKNMHFGCNLPNSKFLFDFLAKYLT